jgi:molybdate transport system ATP-binding protein
MIEVAARLDRGGFLVDAAFTAGPGVTALFGPSGSGKSTLLGIVAGLIQPDRGRVVVGGRVFTDTEAGIRLSPRLRRCGLVFQDGRLFPHLTVRGNLLYGWRRAPRPRPIEPEPVAALLGLERMLARRPRTLSGGERQRVALGRALLSQPALLLMDEPLAALDAPRKGEILRYIEALRDAHALPILYVSHAFDEVARLADRLVLLEGGKILAEGPIEAVAGGAAARRLLGPDEAGAVLSGRVAAHDAAHHLTRVETPGGLLYLPAIDRPPGAPIRVRIRARDVGLATGPLDGYTALNRLAGTIAALEPEGEGRAVATVDLGGASLVAAVTTLSVERLALRPGLPVTAIVKSVAFASAGAA